MLFMILMNNRIDEHDEFRHKKLLIKNHKLVIVIVIKIYCDRQSLLSLVYQAVAAVWLIWFFNNLILKIYFNFIIYKKMHWIIE
jgi:hypothetical protein